MTGHSLELHTRSRPFYWPWLALLAAGGCWLLAVFLPQNWLVAHLTGPLAARSRVAEGVSFWPFFLSLDGFLLLGLAFSLWRQNRTSGFTAPSSSPFKPRLYPPQPATEKVGREVYWLSLALLAVLTLATVLRFSGAGGDLWLDETGSLPTVRLPAYQLIATYQSPNQHVLYALLANLSSTLLGENSLTLRLPALLFGVGGVWALYRLGRVLTGPTEALLASLLLAVSYHHIFFSQDARGYTAMVCLSLLTSALFLRAVETNRAGLWVGYAVLSVLNVYVHMYGAFVVAGHLTAYGVLLLTQRFPWSATWPLTRRLLLATGAIALVSLQLYVLILPQVLNYFVVSERKGIGFGYSSSTGFLAEVVRGLQIGFVGLAGLAILGIFGLVGLISYLRQSLFSLVALFAWMGFPVLSVVLLKMGVYPRFFLFALPIGLLLVVRGVHLSLDWLLARLGAVRGAAGIQGQKSLTIRNYAWVGAVVLGAVVSAFTLAPLYSTPKQDFSGALAYAEQARQPGDTVVAVNMAGPVYQNYYRPDLKAAQDVDDLTALRREGHALWLIYIFPADMQARFPELYSLITSQSQPIRRFPGLIGDGEIYLNRMAPTNP